VNTASGYTFTLDIDIWDGHTSSASHQFSIAITGPGGYSYSDSGVMDTGAIVQFVKGKSAAALLPAARSASTLGQSNNGSLSTRSLDAWFASSAGI
jgi:hypothetical protein